MFICYWLGFLPIDSTTMYSSNQRTCCVIPGTNLESSNEGGVTDRLMIFKRMSDFRSDGIKMNQNTTTEGVEIHRQWVFQAWVKLNYLFCSVPGDPCYNFRSNLLKHPTVSNTWHADQRDQEKNNNRFFPLSAIKKFYMQGNPRKQKATIRSLFKN